MSRRRVRSAAYKARRVLRKMARKMRRCDRRDADVMLNLVGARWDARDLRRGDVTFDSFGGEVYL